MQLKQKVTSLIKITKKIPTPIIILVIFLLFAVIAYLIKFLPERTVAFSYGGDTCINQITLLPDLNKITDNSGFTVENSNVIKLSDLKLLSLKTCFSASEIPSVGDNKLSVSFFGSWFAKQNFKLIVSDPPIIQAQALLQPISVSKPLTMEISDNDLTFDYQLEIGDKILPCSVQNLIVSCDIASLGLAQGSNYEIKLNRIFNGSKVETLIDKSVNTIKAATIISSSIGQGWIIYDDTKSFSFVFDKEILSGNVSVAKINGDIRTIVPSTALFSGAELSLSVVASLERDTDYEIVINNVLASDSSGLLAPYILDFTMSDGPIVLYTNVDSYGISLTKTIILTFDQNLATNQDINNFVATSGIATTISKLNNQVFINFSNAPLCADLSIYVNKGLMSNYGIAQDHTWSFTTRTICHTISSIGYSVGGRSITAYTFGTGPKTILYTGSIHGNEVSARYLMNAWIDELELNARNIPADTKIIVIPNLNPDGYASNTRNNLNNVDLNRNFPTADWQSDIFSPFNEPISGGGGSTPLSELESQAIADFTAQLMPRLTMSFHSSAGYVIANQAGDSTELAAIYQQLSGYSNVTGDGGAFSYPITGTYDDWLREEYNLPSVLVELFTNTSSEFSRNKAALWAMARS